MSATFDALTWTLGLLTFEEFVFVVQKVHKEQLPPEVIKIMYQETRLEKVLLH
jgi:hypothetical protein